MYFGSEVVCMNKIGFIRSCVAICMVAFSFLATFVFGKLIYWEDDNYVSQWVVSCIALGIAVTGLLWKCGVI